MCPNSSTGEHNFQLKVVNAPGGTVVYRECILCGAQG